LLRNGGLLVVGDGRAGGRPSAETLRDARARLGLTQAELGERIGLDERTIRKAERDPASVGAVTMGRITQALGGDPVAPSRPGLAGLPRLTPPAEPASPGPATGGPAPAGGSGDAGQADQRPTGEQAAGGLADAPDAPGRAVGPVGRGTDEPAVSTAAEARRRAGTMIRERREAVGHSARSFAALAGVSRTTLAAIEGGAGDHRDDTLLLVLDRLEFAGSERDQLIALLHGLPNPRRYAQPVRLEAASGALLGRDGDLRRVEELIATGPLTTITGPAGVGKTRLALEIGRRRARTGEVVLVQLAAVSEPAAVPLKIAAQLGITDSGEDSLDGAILRRCGTLDLLVLDNLEQVVEVAPFIGRIAEASPGLRVLVTSRVALGLGAELIYPLAPIRVAGPEPGAGGADPDGYSPAVVLFLAHAARYRPGWTPSDREVELVRAICTALDGLPLAIELAASRMRAHDPSTILTSLRAPLKVLRSDRRDLAERHRAMTLALDPSYAMLGAAPARLFRLLSVLAPDFSFDLAADVTGPAGADSVLDDIEELVAASLLAVRFAADGTARYGWLNVIRHYAADLLAELDGPAEAQAGWQRYAASMVELAERAEPELTGDDQVAWLEQLEQQNDHLRAVSDREWAVGGDTAARLAAAMWRFWYIRGHFTEGIQRLRRVLSRPGLADLATLTTIRHGLGALLYMQGHDPDEAEATWRAALAGYRELGERRRESSILANLGMMAQYRGELEQAAVAFTEALAVAEESGDPRAIAVALAQLASLATQRGQLATAIRLTERGVATFADLRDRQSFANMVGNLGEIWYQVGDFGKAVDLLDEALAVFDETRDPISQGDVYWLLGRIAMEDERWDEAGRRLAASADLAQRTDQRWGVAACQALRAVLAARAGDPSALALVDEAISMQRSLEHEPGLVDALVARGEVLLVRGERTAAARTFAEVIEQPDINQAMLRNAAIGLAEASEPIDPAAVERLTAGLCAGGHRLPDSARRRLDRVAVRSDSGRAQSGPAPAAAGEPGAGPLDRVIELVEKQFVIDS